MGETKQRPRSTSGPLVDSSQLDGEAFDYDLSPGAVPELDSVIADKYRVERLIARGGMGAVYSAIHLVSGKRVALKWMLPALGQIAGARERFVREACATARIDHPNIVDIYDVGNHDGSVYLVMEYLHGETLSERLEREHIPTQDAIALMIPALRGVAAAHSHGVIHRDLKPDNIFLCRTGEGEPLEPKVLDFGISKITSGDSADHSLTRSGAVLGTPYYMSPEQVRGARDVDQRADVYAFGVMLYEVFTGQRPFDAETYNQLILKIVTETPAPIATLNPSMDPRLIQIVERAMVRDPALRFPTIEALALALEPYSGGVRFRSSTTPYLQSRPSIEISPTLLEAVAIAPAAANAHLLAAAAAERTRVRTTVTSAVVALVLCSAGFWWLRTQNSLAAANKLATEHQVAPAPLAPRTPPTGNSASKLNAPQPTSDRVETTTNAAATPPVEAVLPIAAPTVTKQRATAMSRRASPRGPIVRDKHTTIETASASPKQPTPTGDWDERLSNSPEPGASATPAGRLDQHDFR